MPWEICAILYWIGMTAQASVAYFQSPYRSFNEGAVLGALFWPLTLPIHIGKLLAEHLKEAVK